MKIAVIGASGNAGSRITTELAGRGHAVTAIARNPDKIAVLPNVTATSRRRHGPGRAGRSSCRAMTSPSVPCTSSPSDPAKLIGAAKASGVGRYLVVGGAGSLEVAPGVRLVTTPSFPAQYKAEAEKGGAFLDLLRPRKGAELDLPLALGPVRRGRADRQVPARDRPASDRRRREKLDQLRGLRRCTRRRNRAAGPYKAAFYGRLLSRIRAAPGRAG